MLPEKFKVNEAGTIGLPIRITVLTIVGFVGFYTMLSALGNSPVPQEPMYAAANTSQLFLPAHETGNESQTNLSLIITVFDRDNRGIEAANLVVWSPDRKKACSGITDSRGKAAVRISNPELPPGKVEGYISIKVMKAGYRDFAEDYFVKVIRG